MKKVLIVCIVILALLGSCFAFGGHEQRMSQYVEAPVQEATFEALLAAPYTTEGAWEFYDVFSLYHDAGTWGESEITPETHQELIAQLCSLLKDQTFTCAQKQGAFRSYDGYFEKTFFCEALGYAVLYPAAGDFCSHPCPPRRRYGGDWCQNLYPGSNQLLFGGQLSNGTGA